MTTKQLMAVGLCAIWAIASEVNSAAIASVVPDETVSVYTSSHFAGTRLVFSPNTEQSAVLQPGYRNTISSLSVPVGYKVTLINIEQDSYQMTFMPGHYVQLNPHIDNRADIVVVSRL